MKRIVIFLIACIFCASCAEEPHTYNLIPYPNSLTPKSGVFSAAGAPVAIDNRFELDARGAVEEFTKALSAASGRESAFTNSDDPQQNNGFRFVFDQTLPAENYTLDVEPRKTTVRASSLRGVLYALQTIRQLLPVEIFAGSAAPEADWALPCVTIQDEPRFAYRGMHIDVARHFFGVDEMKRVVDIMSLHKLNTLHWHLTDDQGWRIEIKRYPALTEVGSIRKQTVVRKEWNTYDGTPYGGYYTQEQIRDVVAYAAAHGIEVIPEIDLPGHMLAALTAYPELGCTGGPYAVWGRWGVADEVLCPGKAETFEFIEGVLVEIIELFPSKYIHIGGDECPKTRWEKCPRCQAKIKQLGLKNDGEHSAEHFLQSYVMTHVEKFLNARDRRIIGWDEMLEGELAPNATVMAWRGSEHGLEAAKRGHDVIMTPTSHFYFDYYQSRDTKQEPFGIGGYVPIERVYSYEPLPDSISLEAARHIIGVQANLWTEYVLDNAHLEYMLLPRMAALSEVQWCRPERKEWPRFAASLPHLISIYDAAGYNYGKAVFEVHSEAAVNHDKKCVELTLSTLGDAPIYYTLDGSEPSAESTRYTTPIEINKGATLKAVALRDRGASRILSRVFVDSKALGRPIVLNTNPREKYRYHAPESLIDGNQSYSSYANGDWAGWFGDPMTVTIDMDGKSYSSVGLSTLVEKGEDIFPPLALVAATSSDGEHFTEIGMLDIPMETASDADGLKSYEVTFPATTARYLRVTARTVSEIPAWHGAKGKKGYLFVDEIIVK